MEQLPDFFWADKLTLVNYYGHPSMVEDKIFEIPLATDEMKDRHSNKIQRFHDLKRKCLQTELSFDSSTLVTTWETDIWDDKIVIECKTERGNTIFVSYNGWTYSIGLSVKNPQWVNARAYKPVNYQS